jgi:Mrp family chromosome partitioning ATPase
MSLIAMLGLMLGGLAASGWVVAADRLPTEPQPADPRTRSSASDRRSLTNPLRREAPIAVVEKPVIARLQESDVIRTLGGIMATSDTAEVTRFGWPTLRPGLQTTVLLNSLRDMRTSIGRRAPAESAPVVTIISEDDCIDRCVAALNFALAAARDGARVLMIDADHGDHELSNKVARFGKSEPSRLAWLSIGGKSQRAITTANGISILPTASGASKGGDAKATDRVMGSIRQSIARARAAKGYDRVVLDGPALPWDAADRELLDLANGVVAVLPVNLDINEAMEDIIASLGSAQQKLAGVILNELTAPTRAQQRSRQYA